MTQRAFHVLLHGAYSKVPYAGKRGSNYVDLPNDVFDPLEGQRILERQMRQFVELEELGFDGGVISEQHNGPIGLNGNPMVAAAWAAARTSSLKIGVVGPLLNAYSTPVRMAEEIAALDLLSRGRVVMGLPLGHGNQYHSLGVMNPATARARYKEAHDLFVKAMTHPGPFEWYGQYFQIPYVNLWPKPLQRPYPEVVVLGGGSKETVDMVAEHRYGYSSIGAATLDQAASATARFRALCRDEFGYETDPRQVWSVVTVHVAETDEIAHAEHEPATLWNAQNFFQANFYDSFPPGYMSTSSMRGVLSGGYRSADSRRSLYEQRLESGLMIVGSPDTVASQLETLFEAFDPGQILLDPVADSKPEWVTRKSLQLFAEEVLPRFRGGDAEPRAQHQKLAGYESLSEYGARRTRDERALVDLGDGLVDAETAHVPALREALEPWPPQS